MNIGGSPSAEYSNTSLCLKISYCYIKFINLYKLLSILFQICLCPLQRQPNDFLLQLFQNF